MKLLLVEDYDEMRKLIKDDLIDLKHEVTEASDGSLALEILKENQSFDAIISDYQMPNMNGLDLAIQVSKLDRKPPIILFTGVPELLIANKAAKNYFYTILKKPEGMEDLLIHLENISRG